jgi:Ankyrin repeats (3 copies)
MILCAENGEQVNLMRYLTNGFQLSTHYSGFLGEKPLSARCINRKVAPDLSGGLMTQPDPKPKSSGFPRTYVNRIRLLVAIIVLFVCPMSGRSATRQVASPCETSLILAIRLRKTDEVRKLIRSNVNLNERACPEGNTALFEALGSQPEIAKELIEAGADPNETDTKKTSPLMSAAFYCYDGIVSSLLKKGAKINMEDSDGESALMYAASRCMDGKITALLLRSGASINHRNNVGETALTTAAFYGNETAVMELVAAGADIQVETFEGETALSVAQGRSIGRQPSHDRICSFLSSFTDR